MKFMTTLETIIMNRIGCNRETANLVANDILAEVDKADEKDEKEFIANAKVEAITSYKNALLREVECFDECTVDNPLAETHCVVREEYIYEIANKMLEELR